MKPSNKELDTFLSFIFSDETSLFLTPVEPEPGDHVHIRLRLKKESSASVFLFIMTGIYKEMHPISSEAMFDWYEVEITCPGSSFAYGFHILWQEKSILYLKTGPIFSDFPGNLHDAETLPLFRIVPGFHVPEWAKGAVQYQIFTDRFCNGDPGNDVRSGEYLYMGQPVRHAESWTTPLSLDDYRCFYGGDLAGILQKLDYLQALGVSVLYLNPIFISPSSHKYDTQDYSHVDPHLTAISVDEDHILSREEKKNSDARQYIARTTFPQNLDASDAFFEHFCQEVHRRGMKIILDGVFNHCGSFHRWIDCERIYPKQKGFPIGAFRSVKSPYRNYFNFSSARRYESWWHVGTLPKLNYESSHALCEEILQVAEKWVSPPYSVDGWRLDVAADLGHSSEFNHGFWKTFRQRVKQANPNAIILAEHYGNPLPWLYGDEWDTVMNYDAFMEPFTYFLTGMEKHSDAFDEKLYQNGDALVRTMLTNMANLPMSSLLSSMNELSNHDHSRFLTRTNRKVGRLHSSGSKAASAGICKGIMREAVLIQMTWPGSPTIYYGDEAGLTGWTDPDNRRPYPWGQEDQDILSLHTSLIHLRDELPVFKNGSTRFLCSGKGMIAYARFNEKQVVVIACNNLDVPQVIALPLACVGLRDQTRMYQRFLTDETGYQSFTTPAGLVLEGQMVASLSPHSAVIYLPDPTDYPKV